MTWSGLNKHSKQVTGQKETLDGDKRHRVMTREDEEAMEACHDSETLDDDQQYYQLQDACSRIQVQDAPCLHQNTGLISL